MTLAETTVSTKRLVGIDEAGRGALAGPVIAAAVILPSEHSLSELTDSKLLTAAKRVRLAEQIKALAVAWAIGRAEPREIDAINIHHASLLAMRRAVCMLEVQPDFYIVDGKYTPDLDFPGEARVKADLTVPAVSAASILAKVYRDKEMTLLASLLPDYAFEQHKGYPTKQHKALLEAHGPSYSHRMSYSPVKLAVK